MRGVHEIREDIPFTLSYKGKEMDFELDAKSWRRVAEYAYELVVDNMSMWGLETLSDEDFERVVLDFNIILDKDWFAIKDIFYEVYFTSDPYECAVYTFEKGVYSLRYINEKLSN